MQSSKIIILVFTIFFIAFVYLLEQISSERTKFRLESLKEELETEKNGYNRLFMEYNNLWSLEYLEKQSRRLDMNIPKPEQIIYENNR